MKKTLLLLFCFAVTLNVYRIQAQNLLTNPGFETWAVVGTNNLPSNWTISVPSNVSKNTVVFNSGASSCKANNTNISQTVAVTAGKTYTFKISYYYHTTTGNGVQIRSYFKTAAGRAKMSLEDSLALNGPGGTGAYFPKVAGVWKTYTCDVVAPVGATFFVFNVAVASTSTVSLDDCGFTPNTTPTIYPSTTALTGFTYAPGSGPSAEQSFNVRASNLSGNMTITPPANYEISLGTGSSFVAAIPSMTISNSAGLITSMTVYVRLKAGLVANTYSGNLTLSAVGATQNIALSGSVVLPPVVITPSVTTLPTFTYVEGSGPSAQQTFTVSGTGLTTGIIVTAPTKYEISLVSGSFNGATSFTIPQAGGVIATTPIYIRLMTGLTAANYNGNVTLASTGGTTKTIALTGTVTTAPGLSVTPTSLTGFSYRIGAGPSAEQSFTVSGISLSTFIVITPPAGYEVSTGTGSSFSGTNYLVLPQTGTLTSVYVRLKTGLAVSNYAGNISITSGSYSKTVSLNGNVLLGTSVENTSDNGFKAYGNGSEIVIEGTALNETVTVYNLVGMQLKSIQSRGERIVIPVSNGSVYLVRTATKTVKVIL